MKQLRPLELDGELYKLHQLMYKYLPIMPLEYHIDDIYGYVRIMYSKINTTLLNKHQNER